MRRWRRLGFFGAMLSCVVTLCPRAFSTDKAEIVKRARAMYYNLASHGVKEFRCTVAPNWKKFLASSESKAMSEDASLLKRLNLLQFELSATVDDQPKVTPSTIGAVVLDDNLMQLITGVKQMVQGFFETWRGFMITNPLDGCDADSLEEGSDNYRISSKATGLEVKTVMAKDLTITEVLGTYGENNVRIAPKFVATSEGLLLASAGNEIEGAKTRVVETIEYGDVEGLKLPSNVHIDVSQPGGHVVIDVAFTNYRIRKK